MKTRIFLALALIGVIIGLVNHQFSDKLQSAALPKQFAPLASALPKPFTFAGLGNQQVERLDSTQEKRVEQGRLQALASARQPVAATVEAVNADALSNSAEQQAVKVSSLSPLLAQVDDLGSASMTLALNITVGLQLRNQRALDAYLADVSNPDSPNYQHFLSQAEFNALYAPTVEQEQQVVNWLTASGFQVTERFENRLVVGAVGNHAAALQAFAVMIHNVEHQNQTKYAVLQEPSLPAGIKGLITGVGGLDNLVEMKPKAVSMAALSASPHDDLETSYGHFGPQDVKVFYNDNKVLRDINRNTLNGAGQTVVIAGAYAWNSKDVNGFNAHWSLPDLTTINSQQVCTGSPDSPGCLFNNPNSIEVSLDAEYVHATVPGAKVQNYMATTTSLTSFTLMYNQVVLDNPGHVVTTSWGSCEANIPIAIQVQNNSIIANGNAVGQTWLASSGDNGSDSCGNGSLSVDHPANSPHVIGVGGTTPTCISGMNSVNPNCGGYGSETGWPGSGGGSSLVFKRPVYQNQCGIAAATLYRQVPDVSLSADPNHYGYYAAFNGNWYLVGGTSAATPQWAGYFVQLNQYKPGNGKGMGLAGGRLYKLCGTTAYNDITSGDNGAYSSGSLFDNVTGIGSINVTEFLSLY